MGYHGVWGHYAGFVGLANWLIPMQVGAPDMALPRMNNLSFWILPFAFGMMISTLFMEGGGPNLVGHFMHRFLRPMRRLQLPILFLPST